MAIYTKTGDKGTTGLFDGVRIPKDSNRVQAYGTLDELNAHISLCEKVVKYERTREILHKLQGQLFRLCAEVATADIKNVVKYATLLEMDDVAELEHIIDEYTAALPPLRSFIYQGNNQAAAELHVARTVCRRAERALIVLSHGEPLRPEAKAFVNRLSDCIFTLARMEDFVGFTEEVVKRVTDKLAVAQGAKASATDAEIKGTAPASKAFDLRRCAMKLLEGAIEKSEAMKVPVVVSVVDASGNPVLLYRMDGALLVSNDIAQGKAYTAVALKAPTQALSTQVLPGSPLYQIEAMVNRKIVTFGGGFPIRVDGTIVGGLGISGGTVDEDVAIGTHALMYMEDSYGK